MNDTIAVELDNIEYVYSVAMRKYNAEGDGFCARMDRMDGLSVLRALYSLGLVDEDNNPTWR